MTKPNTLNSDNNVKRVHDSTLNPSFGRDSHVQQVTPGRHPATARTQQLKLACWNVRTLYQKGKLDNVNQSGFTILWYRPRFDVQSATYCEHVR